jgi:hypothetical protein
MLYGGGTLFCLGWEELIMAEYLDSEQQTGQHDGDQQKESRIGFTIGIILFLGIVIG